ncbi:hypothetical protein SLEP1_g27400 [Rubroshorea leprosula]|uniref:Uncharacterized protein n=1 Tax=Rubroshorea leprosula TaxID=152421 RepID=A0AAV5JQF5_9ROSI|nr:hypothetical protein SLEP1_g27400 [Rubroshorea leprosula]
MGKKLDALLCRNFKVSKFENLANLAISRIAYLEKRHRVRFQQARSDTLQLLDLGQKDRALLRLEHLIREQNMLDTYAMIENYLNLLMERIVIIQNNKKCPDELKEAISSLIFAASRCGELPELQKIRRVFTSRYGKDLETQAVELRNNCGVSPKIVKKLSTRRPSLDSKLKVLKEVAPTHGILKQIEGESSVTSDNKIEAKKQQKHTGAGEKASSSISYNSKLEEDMNNLASKLKLQEKPSKKNNVEGKKYRDAKTAAQAAFDFAAHAAEAAKAAVELATNKKNDPDSTSGSSKSKDGGDGDANLKDKKKVSKEFDSNKINATGSSLSSTSGGEDMEKSRHRSHRKESERENKKAEKGENDSNSGSGSRKFGSLLKNQEDSISAMKSSLQKPGADALKSGASPSNFGRRPLSVRTRLASRLRSL